MHLFLLYSLYIYLFFFGTVSLSLLWVWMWINYPICIFLCMERNKMFLIHGCILWLAYCHISQSSWSPVVITLLVHVLSVEHYNGNSVLQRWLNVTDNCIYSSWGEQMPLKWIFCHWLFIEFFYLKPINPNKHKLSVTILI